MQNWRGRHKHGIHNRRRRRRRRRRRCQDLYRHPSGFTAVLTQGCGWRTLLARGGSQSHWGIIRSLAQGLREHTVEVVLLLLGAARLTRLLPSRLRFLQRPLPVRHSVFIIHRDARARRLVGVQGTMLGYSDTETDVLHLHLSDAKAR